MTPTAPIPASLATACAAHDRHRLDVLDALLDEAAPSAVRELLGAALDLCASLRADRDTHRDALAAQLDMARAADLARDAAESTNADQLAILRAELIRSRTDLASERAHLAACQTRIAGLEQAANERSAEVARLTARVAELEARPVLTEDALHGAIKEGLGDWRYNHSAQGWPGTIQIAVRALAKLGPVTLPAQDAAERMAAAYCDAQRKIGGKEWLGWSRVASGSSEVRDLIVESMRRALASLGAPPTSPPVARPVFAGVSEEELCRVYGDAFNPAAIDPRADAIRAVLARLEVSLVAPVDPEAVAKSFLGDKAWSHTVGPSWDDLNSNGRATARDTARRTLTAAGIPVTPEVGK